MDDLIVEFIAETSDSLNDLDTELIRLEQDPGDQATLGNIFRIMHTIKGTCGFLGLPRLASVAHASENVLGLIREGKLAASQEAVSLVLESLDAIKQLLGALAAEGGEPVGDDTALIRRLDAFCASGGAPEPEPEPEPEPIAVLPDVAAHTGEVSLDELEALFQAAPGPEEMETLPVPVPVAAREAALAEGMNAVAHSPAVSKASAAPAVAAGGGLIRVNVNVLESLMQMVSELVLTRNQLLQLMRSRDDEQVAAPMQRLNHITSELQDNVMKTRMQPISNAWTKFPRLVRDLALELGKKIELRMEGEETELDRQVLEMIKDPLTHMVRNSADHGLERPDIRRTAGKPETGTILLRAFHEGGHIIIEIRDNGNGIPVDKVKAKCLANGLVSEAQLAQMSDKQIIQYIFQAGFSTAEKVTAVSGRGVGMDVVRSNIEKIGGTVEVSSEQGKGSVFQIKIPLTLAIVSILIVETSGQRFAVPQLNVQEVVRVGPQCDYVLEDLNGAPVLRLRELLLPVLHLDALLELQPSERRLQDEGFIIIAKVGGQSFGLMVDRVFDTEEIVVKRVAPPLRHVPLYSGFTILGDGSVILILDPNGLARQLGQMDLSAINALQARPLMQLVQEKTSRFLVFRYGDAMPKAVSLDMVARLEEVDTKRIEYASGKPILHYRGGLIRMLTLNDSVAIPKSGIIEVVVFHYGQMAVGLYVEEIRDIAEVVYNIQLPSDEPWCLGSMTMQDTIVQVIDVGYLINQGLAGNFEQVNIEKLRPKSGATPRVLLVEDSRFFIQLIQPIMEKAGYAVEAHDHPHKALEALQANTFDLMVTDVEMPDMNGMELAMACRNIPQCAAMPIVAFTSKTVHQLGSLAQQAGIDAVVNKTDAEGLLKQIYRSLHPAQEMVA